MKLRWACKSFSLLFLDSFKLRETREFLFSFGSFFQEFIRLFITKHLVLYKSFCSKAFFSISYGFIQPLVPSYVFWRTRHCRNAFLRWLMSICMLIMFHGPQTSFLYSTYLIRGDYFIFGLVRHDKYIYMVTWILGVPSYIYNPLL